MAGITDAEFLNKVIPFGFDTATLGGYSLDAKTIEASEKIIKRGRNEFHFPQDEIVNHIEKEVNLIKKQHPNVKVSANVRSTTPRPIIEVSNIDNLDIVEINCHCRQDEILAIGDVVDNASCEVSVKIRANVDGIDTLKIAKLIENTGADYLHIDAMKVGIFDADYDLLAKICSNTNIKVIGNNSIDSEQKIEKMLKTGVFGFSIARAVISGKLNFNISDF